MPRSGARARWSRCMIRRAIGNRALRDAAIRIEPLPGVIDGCRWRYSGRFRCRSSSRACVVSDDRHAFAELVRRHQSAVRACLRKLTAGNHALADDLAQETFVLAWRNLKSFRQEARFSTWLYRIATNCWLADARKRKEELLGDRDDGGRRRRRRRRRRRPIMPDADHARGTTLKIDLERAMARAVRGERAAIVQCYHNDLSHEEAAYVLGCPVGTVKTHVLRGKQKLKRALAAWAPSPRHRRMTATPMMTATPNSDTTDRDDPPSDWVDGPACATPASTRARYIDDAGFTAQRHGRRCRRPAAVPAWRKPAIVALWALAGVGSPSRCRVSRSTSRREAYRLLAAQPVSLPRIAFMVAALGAATWTAAAVALRSD